MHILYRLYMNIDIMRGVFSVSIIALRERFRIRCKKNIGVYTTMRVPLVSAIELCSLWESLMRNRSDPMPIRTHVGFVETIDLNNSRKVVRNFNL